MPAWPAKPPSATVAYGADFSPHLNGLTIASGLFEVVEGTVTLHGQNFTTTAGNVFVRGGVDGESAVIRCTVELSDGDQTWTRKYFLKIDDDA